jgi:hypothetical protein
MGNGATGAWHTGVEDEGFSPCLVNPRLGLVALHAHRLEAQHILNTPPSPLTPPTDPLPPPPINDEQPGAPSQGFLARNPCRGVPAEPSQKRIKQFLREIGCT